MYKQITYSSVVKKTENNKCDFCAVE